MGDVHVSGCLGVAQKEENSGRGKEAEIGLILNRKMDSQDERMASAEREDNLKRPERWIGTSVGYH